MCGFYWCIRLDPGALDGYLALFLENLVLVNCGAEFKDIGAVADGFSDLMAEVLEERGRHARTVMGTRNLPNNNIPCEVEAIIKIKP